MRGCVFKTKSSILLTTCTGLSMRPISGWMSLRFRNMAELISRTCLHRRARWGGPANTIFGRRHRSLIYLQKIEEKLLNHSRNLTKGPIQILNCLSSSRNMSFVSRNIGGSGIGEKIHMMERSLILACTKITSQSFLKEPTSRGWVLVGSHCTNEWSSVLNISWTSC